MAARKKAGMVWRVVLSMVLLGAVVGRPALGLAVDATRGLPPQVVEMLRQQAQSGATVPGAAIGSAPTGSVPVGTATGSVPVGTPTGSEPAGSVTTGSTMPTAPLVEGAPTPATADSALLPTGQNEPLGLPPAQPAQPAQMVAPVVAPEAVEAVPVSLIESQYRGVYSSSLGANLTQFGYKIFNNAQINPDHLALPSDDYRIGPGDKLRIRVWGSGVDSEFVGVVERNGTVNVPQIGIVDVAGVSYGQVGQVIRKESEKYIQGVNINVTLVDLRSVEVYVVGSVPNPSLHMVPAFSTVFDGLASAGGVDKSGSLRNIELYRQGKLVRRFDLYDLLLHGKRDADLVLENRDVIFVPRLGETVAVSGAVGEAAIFELNGEKTVADCLALAGGLLPQGYAGRLHLRRYHNNREFVVQDINTERDPQALAKTAVKNGDLIEWIFLPEKMAQVVTLEGQVWSPDVFQYRPGMTISEVLPSARILKPGAVTDFALLHRYDTTTTLYTPMRIPLDDLFHGKFTMPLKPHDLIQILSREEIGISEQITISGAVWKPGAMPYSPGLTLDGAMALAGGERTGALLSSIEVSRQVIKNGEAITTIFNLDYSKDSGFVLEPKDSIMVKQVKDANTILTVHIQGEVRYPGDYTLNEGEHLSDLIRRAGGFLPSAYFYGAKFTSQRALGIQQRSITDMISGLELQSQQAAVSGTQATANTGEAQGALLVQEATKRALTSLKSVKAEGRVAIQLADLATFAGSEYDFVLEGEDTLVIPRQHNFISIVGSVYSPNSFHYEPNRSVDYYLRKSGGPTKEADKNAIYIIKANGETVGKGQGAMFSFSRFGEEVLMPGDTIVVPVDFERVPHLTMVKDIADIVFKIATTAGVAIAALP